MHKISSTHVEDKTVEGSSLVRNVHLLFSGQTRLQGAAWALPVPLKGQKRIYRSVVETDNVELGQDSTERALQ